MKKTLTTAQMTKRIARINKLNPGAKTNLILSLQDEADNRLRINEDLRIQIDALLVLKSEQIKAVSELHQDIKLIQARHVAEERVSSQMKTAFIAVQNDYIQLLKSLNK